MTKNYFILLLALFYASISRAAYVPLPITSGLNADVIANGVGSATLTTSIDVDGVNYVFAANGWQANSTSTPINWGLPASGLINSAVAATSGLQYNLAPYGGNNSLRIPTNGISGTLTFGYTPKAKTVYVLATSGSGISNFVGQINFSDNTSQAISTDINVPDWFGGTTQPTALGGFGRVNRNNDGTEPNANDPRLYQIAIPIDVANQDKSIVSIVITKTASTSTAAVLNVFAISADIISNNDAGVASLVSPVNFCAGTQDIKVNVKNYGNTVINNVQVNWSMNGTAQTPFNLSLPLDTIGGAGLSEREVLLGTYTFTNAPVDFKSWTSAPNALADTFNFNDTLNLVLQSSLAGTYTINSATPTGGSNYQTFTEFSNALSTYGVCGPVVANVVSGSGPYVETVTFGNIVGASAVNTIKINGNGATVEFNNTTSARQLLTLNGTKYMSIDSLTFKALSTTFGWGALITNGAYKDSITRCTFDLTSITTTSSGNTTGIAFSPSNTSPITTGGTNGTACFIGSNLIKGGTAGGGTYYTLTLMGGDSNVVYNNTLENFYMYGIYIVASNGHQILNNVLHRATKTSVTTFYGIYTSGIMNGTKIMNNQVHSPGGTASSTSSAYGYYLLGDGTPTEPVIVANNTFYNINQGGIIYGFYLSAALYNEIHHNTIIIDKVLTGTSTNYGLYATGANTGTKFYNNLISITAGTGGSKYGFYYNTANTILDAQRNGFHINSTQSGTQYYGYYTTNYATQTAFQNAYPALEIGSLTANPMFTNAATGNLLPTNSIYSGNGINLGSLVLFDINGAIRQGSPTPGAFEMPSVAGPNAGLTAFIEPTGIFCAGMQPVKATVMNSGTTQLSNFQIQWTLNNVAQTPYNFTALIDTFGGAGQFIDTVTLGTINIPVGNNDVKAWIILTGDISNTNDTIQTVLTPTVFTIAALSDTVCFGGEGFLNLSPNTGYSTGMIQWQSSTNGTTFSNIANADAPTLSQLNMSSNTWYRTLINSGVNGCISDTTKINVVETNILTTTPGTRCGTGTVTLSATGTPNSTVNWYAAATGGASIGNGNNFTTPSISTTTTFYAASEVGTAKRVGRLAPATATNLVASPRGLYFNANQAFEIVSVTVYSTAAAAGSGVVTLFDQNHVAITTVNVSWPGGGTAGAPLPQIVPIGIFVNPGQNYSLMMTTFTGGGIAYESSGLSPAIYGTYVSPGGACEITSSKTSLTGGPSTGTYYYFYDWEINSSCTSARVPVIATVNPAPTVTGTGANRCGTGTVTLTASSTTSGATFNWYTAAVGGTPVFTGASFTTPSLTTTTTYYVTANTTGCESDRSPVVATINPIPNISGTGSSRCGPGSVTLSASSTTTGAVFNWFTVAVGGTSVYTGASFATPSLTTTTTYYLEATLAGCTSERVPIVATINELPIVSAGNDTAYCSGDSVTLTATSTATNILWNNAATTNSITVGVSGTYSVQVADANGCIGHDTVTVAENTLPTVDLGNDTAICDGDVITLDADNVGSSYLWDNAVTTQTRDISTAGTYAVTVTDANGCSNADTVTFTLIPAPSGTIGLTNNGNGSISLTINNPEGVLGNNWDFGDQSANATTSSTSHTYTADGTYTITLTLYGQCDTITITETVVIEGLSIGSITADQKLLVLYPNPASNQVVIENKHNYNLKEVIVYNVLGQVVLQKSATNHNRIELNVNHLPAGLYNAKIVTVQGNVTRKFELIK